MARKTQTLLPLLALKKTIEYLKKTDGQTLMKTNDMADALGINRSTYTKYLGSDLFKEVREEKTIINEIIYSNQKKIRELEASNYSNMVRNTIKRRKSLESHIKDVRQLIKDKEELNKLLLPDKTKSIKKVKIDRNLLGCYEGETINGDFLKFNNGFITVTPKYTDKEYVNHLCSTGWRRGELSKKDERISKSTDFDKLELYISQVIKESKEQNEEQRISTAN